MWHMKVSFYFPYSLPLFLTPWCLIKSGILQIKVSIQNFLPLQNEALESCFIMKSILAREIYVIHVSIWVTWRTKDSVSWTIYIRLNLESCLKMKISMSPETYIRIFMAVFVIIEKQNKTKTGNNPNDQGQVKGK